MTSKKQISANRKNAKKSKGPMSEEGKITASANATKHGILSHSLYVTGGVDFDDYKELADFQGAFFDSFHPQGMLEVILVDRLFATVWKIRRLYIAEAGMISKRLDTDFPNSLADTMQESAEGRKDVEKGFFRRMRTSHGCENLADGWSVVVELLEKDGLPLSKGHARWLDEELGGRSGYFKAEYVSRCNYAVQNKYRDPEPMDEEEEKKFNEIALNNAKEIESFLRSMADLAEWCKKDAEKDDKKANMIPPIAELEKLQRYDAHLQRVFLQTLHELQRVQSARLGHPAPLAAAVDVTLDSENGFVS